MGAFTAINASRPPVEQSVAPQPVQRPQDGAARTSGRDSSADNVTSLENRLPRGRKRAAAAAGPLNAKRQRSNGFANGMSKDVPATTSVRESTRPAQPRQKTKIAKRSTNVKNTLRGAVSGEAVNTPQPISPFNFYASTTSMDALDSTSSCTSLQSIKAQGGFGCVVYQPSSTIMQVAGTVNCPQPLVRFDSKRDPGDSSVAENARDHQHMGNYPGRTRIVALSSEKGSVTHAEAVAEPENITTARHTGIPTKLVEESQYDSIPNQQLSPDPIMLKEPSVRIYASQASHLHSIGNGAMRPPALPREHFNDSFSKEDDQALVELACAVERRLDTENHALPPRSNKQNIREVDEHENYDGALLSHADRQILVRSECSSRKVEEPVVRKPFASAILDRSPILGASSGLVLRTCFRLGEVYNAGSQARLNNKKVIFEVYARVISSWREPKPGRKQHFILGDLYHGRAPRLHGTFELFSQSRLWERDSEAFLNTSTEGGTKCRAIARMKKDGKGWCLEILSIWEATADDIEFAAGIYRQDAGGMM